MKRYICNCVNPIWNSTKLSNIIDNAKEISRKCFLNNCDIEGESIYDLPLLKTMEEYPNDFTYYRYKGIFFFTHSCLNAVFVYISPPEIEYFYN